MAQAGEEVDLRALDAEIATKIMAWARVEAMCYTPIGQDWCGDDPEGTGGFNRTGRKIVPAYSKSIAAAMQVVEKMRERGWSFACTLYEGKLPYASFCRQTAASSRNAEAETLPEAICRAALRVVTNSAHAHYCGLSQDHEGKCVAVVTRMMRV